MTPRLDVMICTCGPDCMQRIEAMQLPVVDGVRYLVSAQSDPLPLPTTLASRPDIEVHFTTSRGLSNNRNNALDLATAPYSYICDDDLTLLPDGLRRIIAEFDSDPSLDILTMRMRPQVKTYPNAPTPLDYPTKGYYISSVEIALRTHSVIKAGTHFSPLLGIGAPYLGAGEESVFIHQLLHRHSLNGRFIPFDIAIHRGATTGNRPGAPAMRAQGAVIMLEYPLTFIPRAVLKSLRVKYNNPAKTFTHLVQGAIYFLANRNNILR